MIRLIFFILCCLIFFIEISAFLAFVETFSVFFGFLELLVTFVFGLRLVSSRPFVVMQQLQEQLAAGGDPRSILFGGLRLFIAGFCLVLPGLVTDFIGLWLWLATLLAQDSHPISQSEWANDGGPEEPVTHKFDEAWQGDDFSTRRKGKPSTVNPGDIVDATIISTDDSMHQEKQDK